MKLTTQQKLAIYKELENKLSLGITRALDFFDETVSKIVVDKKKELEIILASIDGKDISDLIANKKAEFDSFVAGLKQEAINIKLQVKDGYTPLKGKDYFDGKPGPKGATPVKGKDYFTAQEVARFKKEVTPKKNKDYFDGKDSVIPGPPGPKGVDGSPDKPFDIANKLNTLSEKVEPTVIKGLTKRLNTLEKSIRGNRGGSGGKTGGGMGNWVHQVFDTSSATTSVDLTYKVAANGSAIMVRYQGQMLAHGIQYTISNKTISFTFTLQDSTNVEVSYVRT